MDVYGHAGPQTWRGACLAYSSVNQIGSRLDASLLGNLPRDTHGGIETCPVADESSQLVTDPARPVPAS